MTTRIRTIGLLLGCLVMSGDPAAARPERSRYTIEDLCHPDAATRKAASLHFRLQGQRAVPMLLKGLQSDCEKTQGWCARLLGDRGVRDALPGLMPLIKNGSPSLKAEAEKARDKIVKAMQAANSPSPAAATKASPAPFQWSWNKNKPKHKAQGLRRGGVMLGDTEAEFLSALKEKGIPAQKLPDPKTGVTSYLYDGALEGTGGVAQTGVKVADGQVGAMSFYEKDTSIARRDALLAAKTVGGSPFQAQPGPPGREFHSSVVADLQGRYMILVERSTDPKQPLLAIHYNAEWLMKKLRSP